MNDDAALRLRDEADRASRGRKSTICQTGCKARWPSQHLWAPVCRRRRHLIFQTRLSWLHGRRTLDMGHPTPQTRFLPRMPGASFPRVRLRFRNASLRPQQTPFHPPGGEALRGDTRTLIYVRSDRETHWDLREQAGEYSGHPDVLGLARPYDTRLVALLWSSKYRTSVETLASFRWIGEQFF